MDALGGTNEGFEGGKKKKVKPGSFQGLGLSPPTYKAIMRMGYKVPTPIQRKTIPTILDGQDVVAMARTGSGKTAAFLIPIVERLKTHSVAVGFRAVTLSPTRELAMQTAKFCRQLSKFTDLRCCLLVGGQAMEAQFEHLANNPDIVIATPGRLMHHIVEAELSLSRVEMLVIDEADRLFELGFAEQLQKVLEATPMSRQCLLFSATLPAQLVSFSRAGVKDPVFVRLNVETTLSESLDLSFLYCRKDEKMAAAISTLRFLGKPGKSTIMFVATKHHVEFFGELLPRVGISTAVVYGSMDQAGRNENIAKFRNKKAQVMVTTDVAARGIDVPMLDYVLNYDFPPSGKLFVHRAGRTARAGRSGLAISLVAMDDLPYTVELMLFLGRKLQIADGSEEAEAAYKASQAVAQGGTAGPPLLGSLPPLENEMEILSQLLNDEGSELESYHKSMLASYHLYNKTRPSASKQSVGRAKQLLEDCGGPARMQALVHPAFAAWGAGTSAQGEADAKRANQTLCTSNASIDFIQELRGYRPRAEKIGNVLSTTSMRTMEANKEDAKAVSAATARRALDDESQVLAGGKKKRSKRKAGSAPDSESEAEEAAKVQVRDKPRMSKRARKSGAKPGAGPAGADSGDEFDVAVDGVQVGSDSQPKEKAAKKAPEQFYLSVERDVDEDFKEKGLEMEQYQMDLMPDDTSDIKKAKSVVRWDAKKKKYLPVMVSVDGRVVKSSSHKNESGRKMKGEDVKSDLYAKWAKTTRKRIQKVGEMEQDYKHPLSRKYGKDTVQHEGKAVEFDDQGKAVVDPGAADKLGKRKPVVPFHGEIEAKYLTNKQKRILKKRAKKDTVSGPGEHAKQEMKTPIQMMKEKKKKDQNKLKQKPQLRKERAKKLKDARIKAQEEKQMKYGARTRSKMLVFEGPKHARKKKNRAAPKMYTI